jgi:hypothetical protein
MKKGWFLRPCLVIFAAIVGLVGPVDRSAANTELTPAARLVAPFFDISQGRDTFLILANVSRWVRLDGTSFPCGDPFGGGGRAARSASISSSMARAAPEPTTPCLSAPGIST